MTEERPVYGDQADRLVEIKVKLAKGEPVQRGDVEWLVIEYEGLRQIVAWWAKKLLEQVSK